MGRARSKNVKKRKAYKLLVGNQKERKMEWDGMGWYGQF
jgi:hypothetical protein